MSQASLEPTGRDWVALKRTLGERVEGLWRRGILTEAIMRRARAEVCVVEIDFDEQRFTLKLVPRDGFVDASNAGDANEVLRAMARGQPTLARGEDLAAWLVATGWEAGEPVVSVQGTLRAWRGFTGTA